MEFLSRLFDTSDFPGRWYCGNWSDGHGWLHILSDLGIWSAYLAIPCVLGFFILRRRDLPFRKIFLLFGAFILACGTTHLMEAIIFWHPVYRLAGVIKLFTAVVSWATVIALIPVVPKVLAMRSPEELEREIAARTKAEDELHRANAELETRIAARTEELVKANETLQRQREEFRTTLASIGDAVIATDTDGKVEFLNPVARSLTGWSEDEALGRPLPEVFRIVDEKNRQPAEDPSTRAMREGRIVGLANHTVLIAKNGNERPIDDSAAPIQSEDGTVRGAVLVFRDVTERRRAEEALRNSEQLYRAIGESINYGVWICDPSGRNTYASESFLKLVGLTQEECSSFGWARVLHPDDSERTLSAWKECVEGGEQWDIEHRFRGVDGHWHYILARGVPVKNERGEITAWAGINLDISRLKQFDAELRDADRRKNEFIATLAHELRNPMAPLRNGLEMMRQSNDREAWQRARDMMERQLAQMVRLVDDLLDISRITRNRLELRKSIIKLSAVIENAVETSRPLFERLGHHLTVEVPEEPIYLDADLMRLAQVFWNLLHNSAKYTDPGGQIRLSARVDGDNVVISVQDTGIGIPPEASPRLFEMFSQVTHSLDRSQGGLGIGLALVKGLTEMHGGVVEASSAGVGQGATFAIRLPIVREAPVHEPVSGNDEAIAVSMRRILVVDDNRDGAASLAMLLSFSENETRTAHDGEEALELAEAFRPDVIVLDIGLPKLNGYEVCRQIRQMPWGKKTLIIAATGWGQPEDRRRSKEAGFDHHLVKPLDLKMLEKVLAEFDPTRSE